MRTKYSGTSKLSYTKKLESKVDKISKELDYVVSHILKNGPSEEASKILECISQKLLDDLDLMHIFSEKTPPNSILQNMEDLVRLHKQLPHLESIMSLFQLHNYNKYKFSELHSLFYSNHNDDFDWDSVDLFSPTARGR